MYTMATYTMATNCNASVFVQPVYFSVDGQYWRKGNPLADSVTEWLACWTQAQKGSGSNRSRDVVG